MKSKIKTNYSLKKLNTIRIGGHALYYATPSTVFELKEILGFSLDRNLKFYILGNGSNVLISDKDFNGTVIKLRGRFEEIIFTEDDGTGTCGAGAFLMKLGSKIAERGYTGCSYMGVIPGTVGGAVRINAGTLEEGEIKDHFLNAQVLDPQTGELEIYAAEDMQFEYRKCALSQSRKILLQVTFRLPLAKEKYPGEARETINSILATRRQKHPKFPLNFGSTFKRPIGGKPPGWYLEQVGMKGMRSGGAMVAEEHANWILNMGNATSQDVKKLISEGQKRVFEEFGINLEREVIYLPEDMETWY
ncbi:MAG: UDP-N-acetylmuramate dehydrogenase [Proteobacteria bacterium]|nr:UDP-N-acetylmuramate dehydrogenase [Pseudomonadota bacterium]